MKKLLLPACLLGILFAPCVYADDNPFSGGFFLGGRALSLDHQSANFNQYNGIVPGLFGNGDVSYNTDKYHFDVDAAYLGQDDMYLKATGGKWGAFKFSLYYTEFPHNLSFEDRTIYTDPGSQSLTLLGRASATPANSALWPSTSFDYKIQRKDVGGSVDVTAISPFFFNLTSNYLQREGEMPWSGHSLFAFGDTVELPLPIDDHTTNANALFGWKNKRFYAALSASFSQYRDGAEHTSFQDPFVTSATQAYGTIVGPPDNRSWGLNFNGNAKQLPFSSIFALNAGYQENTSSTTLLNTIETGTVAAPAVTRLALSRPSFNGDVEYLTVGGTLNSNPVKDLSTKLYFKYLDRINDSDHVTFTNPTTPASGTETNALFGYDKTTAGGEATYRFLKNLKGIVGYDFSDTRRSGSEDFLQSVAPSSGTYIDAVPRTLDNTYKAEVMYNPFDWLGGRLMYQKLFRDADTLLQVPGSANLTPNNVTRFDIGNKTQDMWKLTTDLTPLETLDVSLEYAYKFDNYHDTVLGFTKAEENEFIVDGNYVWKGIKFFAFFDYDVTSTDQTQRVGSGDPSSAPSTTNFNWSAYMRNNNYAYGVGTAIPLIKDKLSFRVQYDFEKNQGYADFTSQDFSAANTTAGINNGNIDMAPWDDYTRQSISAMVNWAYTKNIGLVFGYNYSQFKLNDGQLNGYQYVPSSSVYLTGAYTDQNYKVNLYYVKLYYRF